ncbi:PREDICTED: hepatoma-derived growth factor-related protein 2-like [Amphimedon queenslandica]|uniref:PWWP domain-containing protein n=1 Tax=Amphimedon queenslandica TaxID=400682 RepID=A0A1X7VVV1_AMPQE|nr:PREDICTED: hepatoma-derived growth factor-related protein 2-like [Amphimedon queenslandica]|eukprot:XP_019853734.1 PREDICTED: hepatoma-derived growth factor-related protein 2-like [Amphimedon queenslandica]
MSSAAARQDSEDFEVSDLVWAKMRGFPHWPARVLPKPSGQHCPSSNSYYLFFYGTHNVAWLPSKDIVPFKRYQQKFRKNSQRQRPGLSEAVWEIEEDPDLQVSGDGALLKKFMKNGRKYKRKSSSKKEDILKIKTEPITPKQECPDASITEAVSQSGSIATRRSVRLQKSSSSSPAISTSQNSPSTAGTVPLLQDESRPQNSPKDKTEVTIDDKNEDTSEDPLQIPVSSAAKRKSSSKAAASPNVSTRRSKRINNRTPLSDKIKVELTSNEEVAVSDAVQDSMDLDPAHVETRADMRPTVATEEEEEVIISDNENARTNENSDLAELMKDKDHEMEAVVTAQEKPCDEVASTAGTNEAINSHSSNGEEVVGISREDDSIKAGMAVERLEISIEEMAETQTDIVEETIAEDKKPKIEIKVLISNVEKPIEERPVRTTTMTVEEKIEEMNLTVEIREPMGVGEKTEEMGLEDNVEEMMAVEVNTEEIAVEESPVEVGEKTEERILEETEVITEEVFMVEEVKPNILAEIPSGEKTVEAAMVVEEAMTVEKPMTVDEAMAMEEAPAVEKPMTVEEAMTVDPETTVTEEEAAITIELAQVKISGGLGEEENSKDRAKMEEQVLIETAKEEISNIEISLPPAAANAPFIQSSDTMEINDSIDNNTRGKNNTVTENKDPVSQNDGMKTADKGSSNSKDESVQEAVTNIPLEAEDKASSASNPAVDLQGGKQSDTTAKKTKPAATEKTTEDSSTKRQKVKPPPQRPISDSMLTVEALQAYNYNLKVSLIVGSAEPQKALKNLRGLMDYHFSASDIVQVKDLVVTLRKVRRYKGNSRVRSKANEVYNKIKGLFVCDKDVSSKTVTDENNCVQDQSGVDIKKRKVDEENPSKKDNIILETDSGDREDESIVRRSRRSALRGRVNYAELSSGGQHYSSDDDDQLVPEL